MKSKHTPGPWETGSKMSQVITWREGKPVPMCIADCDTKYAPNYEDERCANARLISAAPDLLEACKAAMLLYDLPNIDLSSTAQVVRDQLRAAIQKAEAQ